MVVDSLAEPVPVEQKEINDLNEQDFLKIVRDKNSKKLVKMNLIQRERIGTHIVGLFDEEKEHHANVSNAVDEWDDVWHMVRQTSPGQDAETPNYRTPLSTVVLEVIHANIMNVFFSPKDTVRVLPTEEGDISKIKKLDIFANWSVKNELNLEENFDRLTHASGKVGESPYIMSWCKDYGTEIEITPVMNPADPEHPLTDEIGEIVTQEREIPKLLYNGPKLTVFSRKDYIIPKSATADKIPQWEMRRIPLSADEVMRRDQEGKFYRGVFKEIGGWGMPDPPMEDGKKDLEGEDIPLAKTEKMFVEFYGRLRITTLKGDQGTQLGDEQFEELEDEFIGIVELKSETLCSLKKNRFPLKKRPIKLDLFIPDDEGRLKGLGIMESLDSMQKSADSMHNQYLLGTIQANSPVIFYTPFGNMRNEPLRIKAGFMYPTSDANTIKEIKFSPPDATLLKMIERVENQAQVMFGVSNFAAGVESTIDPTGPAKKAEIVVAQGNVRINAIIKRRLRTLQDILEKWFLLYQANMPPNKFMRITGSDRDNPWEFKKIELTDFALKSIPDFEFTGNILNANKTLEINKKLAAYRIAIENPFFNPQTQQGGQALHAVTKWILDALSESGELSAFLPAVPTDKTHTPEEENARFLQGDTGEPEEQEDHVQHMRSHADFLMTPNLPEKVIKAVKEHIGKHVDMLRGLITRQQVMQNLPQPQTQASPTEPQNAPPPNIPINQQTTTNQGLGV